MWRIILLVLAIVCFLVVAWYDRATVQCFLPIGLALFAGADLAWGGPRPPS